MAGPGGEGRLKEVKNFRGKVMGMNHRGLTVDGRELHGIFQLTYVAWPLVFDQGS